MVVETDYRDDDGKVVGFSEAVLQPGGPLGASFPPPGGLAEYVSGCGPGMTGRGRKGGGRLARAAVDAGHGGGVIVLPGDEDGRCERRLGKRDRGARLALHGT